MSARRAFVTGGTGFLGRNLLDALTEGGWEITALCRDASAADSISGWSLSVVPGDLLDRESLLRAIPEGVDGVFHLAADTSTWSPRDAEQTRVNVEGTRNVVDAALRRGVGRLVHTSSWTVYGLWNGEISEEMPREGRHSDVNYDRSKALAEDEVRAGIERGLEAVILNPAHIIGPYDRKNWSRMIVMTYEGTLPGVPPGSGVFCEAGAVAAAHIAAVDRGRVGENYLLGGAEASFMEVFRIIGELLNRDVPSRPIPAWLFRLVGYAAGLMGRVTGREPDVTPEVAAMVTAHPSIVSDKAERELGYRPIPLRAALEGCIRWLAEEGVIEPDEVA